MSDTILTAEILWAARTSPLVVMGPWEDAPPKYPKGEKLRPLPNKKHHHGASVQPHGQPREPEWTDYVAWDMVTTDRGTGEDNASEWIDQDNYDSDRARYEKAKAEWKPWIFQVSNGIGWEKGMADTQEEAMALADALLREHGVLLLDKV